MLLRFLSVIIILNISFFVNAQNRTDSLVKIIKHSNSTLEKSFSAFELSKDLLSINLDSSLYYANIAKALSISLDNDSLTALIYSNIGNIRIYQGILDASLENYINALNQIQDKHYPTIEQGVLNNMGIVFDRKKEYGKARQYYQKAQDILGQLDGLLSEKEIKKRQGKLFSNIGATFESEGDRSNAMEFYTKGLNLAIEIGEQDLIGVSYSNIGSLYLNEGSVNLAEPNYLEALRIFEELSDSSSISRMYLHLGDLYYSKGENEKAIETYNKAIELAEKVNNSSTVYYSSGTLYKIYSNLGDYKAAFDELLRFKTTSDSLYNTEKAAALERLEADFHFQEERRILQQKQYEKTLWNYGLIALIALMSVIFYLTYRTLAIKSNLARLKNDNLQLQNNHLELEKTSLSEKLEFKNKELTTNVMYLMSKNEFINSLSQKLKQLRQNFKTENKKEIDKIIVEMHKEAEGNTWKEFELHFNQVHSSFYDNLSEKFPELSPNERKICAFIRLNLNTKEISSITYQSPNSLQVARVRLRKKLGLENNESLSAFLQQF